MSILDLNLSAVLANNTDEVLSGTEYAFDVAMAYDDYLTAEQEVNKLVTAVCNLQAMEQAITEGVPVSALEALTGFSCEGIISKVKGAIIKGINAVMRLVAKIKTFMTKIFGKFDKKIKVLEGLKFEKLGINKKEVVALPATRVIEISNHVDDILLSNTQVLNEGIFAAVTVNKGMLKAHDTLKDEMKKKAKLVVADEYGKRKASVVTLRDGVIEQMKQRNDFIDATDKADKSLQDAINGKIDIANAVMPKGMTLDSGKALALVSKRVMYSHRSIAIYTRAVNAIASTLEAIADE